MGYKTIAIFLNDFMYDIKEDKDFGARLASASGQFNYPIRHQHDPLGHKGAVVAVTHVDDTPLLYFKDYHAVDIRRPENDGIADGAEYWCKAFLERNGYRVVKKRVKKT